MVQDSVDLFNKVLALQIIPIILESLIYDMIYDIFLFSDQFNLLSIYTRRNLVECTLSNWNINNFNVLIYFIKFVYAMISCGKYHEMSLFLCLKIVNLLLATLKS